MSEGGPELYVVQDGQRLADIAYERGFLPETIWMHEENAALRAARHRPEGLMPGDQLFIPARQKKSYECQTGRQHRFVRLGTTLLLRVQLVRYAEPLADVEVSIEPDVGEPIVCRSNAHGFVEAGVQRQARRAELRIEPNTPFERTLHVKLALAAWNSVLGAQQRLRNLGYVNVSPTGVVDDATFAAVLGFQDRVGLESNGILDLDTKQSLEALHDTGVLFPSEHEPEADGPLSDRSAASK